MIEYLKAKCKNKTGLSEQNLSFYLKKSKNQITQEVKNTDKEKSKNVVKEHAEKKHIDIFANLKGKDTRTSLEQDMLDFVKEMKN